MTQGLAAARSGVKDEQERGPVTLKRVAQVAGVAISTASRALHGGPGAAVSDVTRALVTSAAEQLGYEPNIAVRAATANGGRVVGLVLSDLSAADVSGGVAAFAQSRRAGVLSAWTVGESTLEQVRFLDAHGVRGLVVAYDGPLESGTRAELRAIARRGTGVCVLGAPVPQVCAVEEGWASAGTRTADILYARGYRAPLVVGGRADGMDGPGRVRSSFAAAMAEFGVEVDDRRGVGVSGERESREFVLRALAGWRGDVVVATSAAVLRGAVAAVGHRETRPDSPDLKVAGVRLLYEEVPPSPVVAVTAVIDRFRAAQRAAEVAFGGQVSAGAHLVQAAQLEIGVLGPGPAAVSR